MHKLCFFILSIFQRHSSRRFTKWNTPNVFTKKRNYFKFRVFHFISPCDDDAPNKSIKESYQPAYIHFEKVILWKMFEMELKLLYKEPLLGNVYVSSGHAPERERLVYPTVTDPSRLPFSFSIHVSLGSVKEIWTSQIFFHHPNEYFITFFGEMGRVTLHIREWYGKLLMRLIIFFIKDYDSKGEA